MTAPPIPPPPVPCCCPSCGRVWEAWPGHLSSPLPRHTRPRQATSAGVLCDTDATVLDAARTYETWLRTRAAGYRAEAAKIRAGKRPMGAEALRTLRRLDDQVRVVEHEADRVAATMKGEAR